MTYGNKDYQVTAIEQLIAATTQLLAKDASDKVCVFQSPTGSGKTVMVAKFIEGIIKDLPDTELCFVWVSIGKGELHKQSKRSLETIFDGFPKCVLVEEAFFGTRKFIERNEVVVVNWEKLRTKDKTKDEWKNKLMKAGEQTSFIKVLENTREKRKIILIIDESHFASETERTNELREIIGADVTLEMSATPKIQPSMQDQAKGIARFVYVDAADVIAQGMIKKEVIINEGIGKLASDEKTSQDVIIEAAYQKRLEIKKHYEKLEVEINPLCLIQIPNSESGESKKEVIEAFLADKKITEANGKLAIWLSEDKSDNLHEISHLESKVEFLIFKQAIDTGWDCPRAHILVKLREIQSFTFEVQTVGRIMRMPEQKHYDDSVLDTGYIFTNLQNIIVEKEKYNPNIIKHLKATRKDIYKPLQLPSYYKNRVDFGDITLSIQSVLEKVFCNHFGIEVNPTMINAADNALKIQKAGLSIDIKAFRETLITDEKISAGKLDELHGQVGKEGTTVDMSLADNDLQDKFSQVIKENLNGFAPKRSVPTMREAVYVWFRKYLAFQSTNGGVIIIQNLFLHNQNLKTFSDLLAKTTDEYRPIKKEEVKRKIQETIENWEVKEVEFYNQHTDEKTENKLCVYDNCYLSVDRSTPEKLFEEYLEKKKDKIVWWFKNGENQKDYFGIKYMENDLPRTFYPDYIIQLKSGTVAIVDPKEGRTATGEAKEKNEALQKYIKSQNRKDKKLIGGLLIQDASSKWRVNQKETYNYDPNNLKDWDFLDDII
jgi:type III restriction enzyme